jgi:hypothetical protein
LVISGEGVVECLSVKSILPTVFSPFIEVLALIINFDFASASSFSLSSNSFSRLILRFSFSFCFASPSSFDATFLLASF